MSEPKFCPWCGSDLSEMQAAIKFCPECGKELAAHGENTPVVETSTEVKPSSEERTVAEKKAKTEKTASKKPDSKKSHKKAAADQAAVAAAINARLDAGYDGYYDDVLPIDYGAETAGLNKAMIKQIALCCGIGAVIIIIMVGIMLL